MRPAHKTISAGVWIVREWADFKLRSRSFESIRTWSFDRYRFAEARSVRKASFHSHKERYICMSTNLYLGNLAFQSTIQELQELFAQAGTVDSACDVDDRNIGRSRGSA